MFAFPAVNALDDYAVGCKKYVDISPEDILNDKFIGDFHFLTKK